MRPDVLLEEEYKAHIRSLNEKQRDVYQHVWCHQVALKDTTGSRPEKKCVCSFLAEKAQGSHI